MAARDSARKYSFLSSHDDSVSGLSHVAIEALVAACSSELSQLYSDYIHCATFLASTADADAICFPFQFRAQELDPAYKGALIAELTNLCSFHCVVVLKVTNQNF